MEIATFQEVITLLRAAGHQVHVTLFAGIPHARTDTCDIDQPANFDQGLSVFKYMGSGQNALIDMGAGFWEEHRRKWDEFQWFQITSSDNEQLLAKMLDRYIMRQNCPL